MIQVSDELAAILADGNYVMEYRAESWLGKTLLAADLYGATGYEESARDEPDRVVLTFPRYIDGVDLSPGADIKHPLAWFGQRLRLEIIYYLGNGRIEPMQRGWFVIVSTTTEQDTVTVECLGLMYLIEQAVLARPFEIGNSFKYNLRLLLERVMPVKFDSRLVDRTIPLGTTYPLDRVEAVDKLLASWAADGRVTEDGTFAVFRTQDAITDPVALYSTVDDTTLIRASGSGSRDGAVNAFVVNGRTAGLKFLPDGLPVRAVVYETEGPYAYPGPFNPYPQTRVYELEHSTNEDAAKQAAYAFMLRNRRRTGRSFEVEAIADHRIQIGDTVSLSTDEFSGLLCTVEELHLPYVASGGPMKMTVRTVKP